MTPFRIETPRLTLRPWQDGDREPLHAMSQDPALHEFLRPLTTRELSDAWIDRQLAHQAEHGCCFWAAALHDGTFIGSVGLIPVGYEAHFTPAIEIGWRIARPFWGQGYAPEAAAAALRHGFGTLALSEIVATVVAANTRSRRVMEKLGMSCTHADDFANPRYPEGDPLRPTLLYRLPRQRWWAGQGP